MPKNIGQKILITGGAGFIGSALIRLLIRETNCHVVNVDKLTYAGNLESLAETAERESYAVEQRRCLVKSQTSCKNWRWRSVLIRLSECADARPDPVTAMTP